MTAPISNGPTTHGYTTMRDATTYGFLRQSPTFRFPASRAHNEGRGRGTHATSRTTAGTHTTNEDYRSRTWCLSSVFRLGLRAKVAVI